MLKAPLTGAFRVACPQDLAACGVPHRAIEQYLLDRDFDALAPHLSGLAEQPTVFHCEPLSAAGERLADTPTPDTLWRIFQTHVRRIDNFDPARAGELGLVRGANGDMELADSVRENRALGTETIAEVAGVIVQRAMGRGTDVSPFSPPGTSWRATAAASARLRAIRETAAASAPAAPAAGASAPDAPSA